MKINIKMMKADVFETIKHHHATIYENMCKYKDNLSWLNKFTHTDELFETKKYYIEDFELKYSDDYKEVEYENAIILYEHLKHLPRYILCSNRFWAWIILEKAYKHSKVAMDFTSDVVNNFWFEKDSRRSVMLNVMGRQFFKVECSVDEKLNDKYAMTKYLFTNHSIYKNIVYRNICMIKNVSIAVIKFSYSIYTKYNIKQNEKICSEYIKHLSRLGSVQLIDIIPEKELFMYLAKVMQPKIQLLLKEQAA